MVEHGTIPFPAVRMVSRRVPGDPVRTLAPCPLPAKGSGTGMAPRARNIAAKTGPGWMRIFRPFMSSGVRTARSVISIWRQPYQPQARPWMPRPDMSANRRLPSSPSSMASAVARGGFPEWSDIGGGEHEIPAGRAAIAASAAEIIRVNRESPAGSRRISRHD
jgi:hypothetical protein